MNLRRSFSSIGIWIKSIFFSLIIFYFIPHSVYGAENWIEVIKDERAIILVEKNLFEKNGHPNFLIHLKIVNRSDKTIGVDFRNKWMAVYPNQWEDSDLDHRGVIDELTMIPKKLDKALRQELIEAYRLKKLHYISPGDSIEYYINFNGDGRNDPEKAKGKYILISLKGQMFFSDGNSAWDENSNYDLALKKPIEWKKIPKDVMVIMH